MVIFAGGELTTLAQLPDVRFEIITSKDGLPSNTVYSAVRDRKGFMWFGTRLYPVRYDGASFQSFKNPQTTFVNGIACDKENNIWFASGESNVCKIDGITQQISQVEGTVDGGYLFIDSKGRGWYSDNNGINRFDLDTRKKVHYPLDPNQYVWNKGSFIEDKEHTVWILAKDNGLYKYDADKDSIVCMMGRDSKDPNRNDSKYVFTKGFVDHAGILWLGTYSEGLVRYNPENNSYTNFETGRGGEILAVCEGWEDSKNPFLWVGDGEGLGVFRPDRGKFYFFENLFPLPFEVSDIYRDSLDGIVWVCTSSGIIKYNPNANKIKTVTLPPDLLSSVARITFLWKDRMRKDEDIYYLGLSHTGVVQWNKKSSEFKLITLGTQIDIEVRCITQRKDGTIWIGTNSWNHKRPGLFVYDPKTEKLLTPLLAVLVNQSFSWPSYEFALFDKQDRFWIGKSDEGILIFDEKKGDVTPWNKTTQSELIGQKNLMNGMILDKHNRILLAMFEGIFHADEITHSFTRLDTIKSLVAKFPATNSLVEDKEGDIWSARWGALAEISASGNNLKTLLSAKDGFEDVEIRGLALDYKGNLWIGNGEGLFNYDIPSKRLQRFTTNDGLVSNNTCDLVFSSDTGKEIFVTNRNSFNIISVDQLLKPVDAPTLAISNFKIEERDYHVDPFKPIVLERFDNALSVNFIALNYRKENDNQYAYYLEGLEETWKPSGSNHEARYTNLNPGNYTLHLRAGDVFGNWNDQTLQLKIEVLPAFYETWWFRVFAFFLLLVILYGLYRYRISQLIRVHQMRDRISADLHDELGASLSGISIIGALVQKKLEEKHPSTPFVGRMMDEVHHISSSLDDIVWSISPKNDDLSNLLARMTRHSSELFEARQINYHFNIPQQVEHLQLSMEQRRNFYLIFKEGTNNLVKYSRCTLATVNLLVEQQKLTLTIEDNGIGFDPQKLTDRNGIVNMKMRAAKLNGSLDIQSTVGKGTILKLEFYAA